MRIIIDIEPSPAPSPSLMEIIERVAPMFLSYLADVRKSQPQDEAGWAAGVDHEPMPPSGKV